MDTTLLLMRYTWLDSTSMPVHILPPRIHILLRFMHSRRRDICYMPREAGMIDLYASSPNKFLPRFGLAATI
ncbi:hypothetical protein XI08_02250 [Bradyrhizobium sp. CCBAU 11361]|nr:hypothetical protein [Bradyrhizobium sp. CCBAU 11361]